MIFCLGFLYVLRRYTGTIVRNIVLVLCCFVWNAVVLFFCRSRLSRVGQIWHHDGLIHTMVPIIICGIFDIVAAKKKKVLFAALVLLFLFAFVAREPLYMSFYARKELKTGDVEVFVYTTERAKRRQRDIEFVLKEEGFAQFDFEIGERIVLKNSAVETLNSLHVSEDDWNMNFARSPTMEEMRFLAQSMVQAYHIRRVYEKSHSQYVLWLEGMMSLSSVFFHKKDGR